MDNLARFMDVILFAEALAVKLENHVSDSDMPALARHLKTTVSVLNNIATCADIPTKCFERKLLRFFKMSKHIFIQYGSTKYRHRVCRKYEEFFSEKDDEESKYARVLDLAERHSGFYRYNECKNTLLNKALQERTDKEAFYASIRCLGEAFVISEHNAKTKQMRKASVIKMLFK
ncbi:hypothetical protein [Fundidesulfovibrio soli]|uniref:hypothetical protein n=1 Tax=Fundidesulfovibrio soli TaxID=2922716 RepID=UPI001FAF64AE|nr:hypothetical protein [Fundidesulfovibrio soli]